MALTVMSAENPTEKPIFIHPPNLTSVEDLSSEHVTKHILSREIYCRTLMEKLAQAVGDFDVCQVRHVKPFALCLGCSDKIREVQRLVDVIKSDVPANVSDYSTPCWVSYSSEDQIDTIPAVATKVIGPNSAWAKGACDSNTPFSF